MLLFSGLKYLEQVLCRCEGYKQRRHLSEPCDWSGYFMMWFTIKGALVLSVMLTFVRNVSHVSQWDVGVISDNRISNLIKHCLVASPQNQ